MLDLKNLNEWNLLPISEVLHIPVLDLRRVEITFNATADIAVFASFDTSMANPVLLGAGRTMLGLRFIAEKDAFLEVRAKPGTAVYFRMTARNFKVAASDEPSHVNIAPRGAPSELQRMMYVLKINERKREETLNKELSRLKRASPPPEPSVPPSPPPEPVAATAAPAASSEAS